jgi:hypothetical protein
MVSRARKRKLAAMPVRTYEWGGSSPDRRSMDEARAAMEAKLVARYPERLGRIEWRVYDGSVADEILGQAGMPKGASQAGDDLRRFIAGTSGGMLIVASVMVRRQDERRLGRRDPV